MTRRWRRYSEADKALMWDRWQKGESLAAIARLFDRKHPSIERIIRETGGIRPLQEKAFQAGSDACRTGGDLSGSGCGGHHPIDCRFPGSRPFDGLP
jgi:hypothetical protein